MISPIHIITIGLGGAFALGFVKKSAPNFAGIFMLLAIAGMAAISGTWLVALFSGTEAAHILTTILYQFIDGQTRSRTDSHD